MLSKQERKELNSKLKDLRDGVANLKEDLNQLNFEKENWFKKLTDVSNKIKISIKEFKSAKGERNNLTKQVHDSKLRRQELNDEVKQKIDVIKKLNSEKQDIAKKFKIEGDPSQIKEEIERLEYSLETNVISFEKEKAIMKQIKEKKKQYEKVKVLTDVFDKMHTLSQDIEKLRDKADKSHKKTQERAGQSQEKHEELISLSKDLNDLRRQENEFLKNFNNAKKQFYLVNDYLKQSLIELNKIKEKVDEAEKTEFQKKTELTAKNIEEKGKEIEKKLKTGQKLTTEDFLIFQTAEKKRRR